MTRKHAPWQILRRIRASFFVLFAAATPGASTWADDARFDGGNAANAYYVFRGVCRIGELDGHEISPAQIAHYCAALDALGFQLRANGWCWNPDEAEWSAPGITTDTGFRCYPKTEK